MKRPDIEEYRVLWYETDYFTKQHVNTMFAYIDHLESLLKEAEAMAVRLVHYAESAFRRPRGLTLKAATETALVEARAFLEKLKEREGNGK